jgi:Tol biopolymer transport system component
MNTRPVVLALLTTASCASAGHDEAPTTATDASESSLVCSRRIGPRSYLNGTQAISEIVLFEANGLASTVVTRSGFRFMPTGSPDGTRIAYVQPTGPSAFNIFEMDLRGNQIRQLTFLDQGAAGTPAYSRDGSWLLYSADSEVQLLDLSTLSRRTLTRTTVGTVIERPNGEVIPVPPTSHHAAFSPDGSEIVYASTQSGHVQVWKMNRDGSAPRQLTDGSHGERYPHANVPSFSLGVDRIVLWSGFEGSFGEVWMMDRHGGQKRQLTETADPGNSDDPFLSPDGRSVVFGRDGPGTPRGMYLLDLPTGTVRLLVEDFQWCNWMPAASQD